MHQHNTTINILIYKLDFFMSFNNSKNINQGLYENNTK